MIDKRNLDNLGTKEYALEALKTIKNLFGDIYLDNTSSKIPLSILWNRVDHLASVELVIFGRCLINALAIDEQWLLRTIKEIKKSSSKAKGLITEIIYLGLFTCKNSKILPAAINKAGYDFSINLSENSKQYISIKNIDISDPQREYQANCNKLRIQWKLKLKIIQQSFGLRVVSQVPLESVDFDNIIEAIKKEKIFYMGQLISPKDGIRVYVTPLPTFKKLSPAHISDTVLVYAPSPQSENTRYALKLSNAASNIFNHTKNIEGAKRVLFIRLHVHADASKLEELARVLVNDVSPLVDCIIFYQPSYGRNSNNSSLLHHYFNLVANGDYFKDASKYGLISCEIPIGTISNSQCHNHVIMTKENNPIKIQPSDYVYQQGDLYVLGGTDGEVTIDSPAPGIHEIGVLHFKNEYLVFKSKLTPLSDELLII